MDMRFLPFAIATALAALVAEPVAAQLPTATEVAPGHLPQADVDFLLSANTWNIAQVAMGHAADSHGTSPGVHSLADRVVSSHMKADQALQLLAAQKHVDLPRRTDDDDHAEIAGLLDRRTGDFDAKYVQNVIDDNDRMIDLYESARNQSVDPDIRRYADIMLPALRDDRSQALALVRQQPGNGNR